MLMMKVMMYNLTNLHLYIVMMKYIMHHQIKLPIQFIKNWSSYIVHISLLHKIVKSDNYNTNIFLITIRNINSSQCICANKYCTSK